MLPGRGFQETTWVPSSQAFPGWAGLVSGPHLSNLGLGITMKFCVYIVFLLARFPSGYNLMPLPLKMGVCVWGNSALLCQRGGRKSQNKTQESWLLGSLSPLGADVFASWRSFPFPGKCLVLSIVRLLGRSCNKQCRWFSHCLDGRTPKGGRAHSATVY